MKSPILLIAFNRYDTLIQVFEKVRKAEPSRLYIAVDGPREKNTKDKIAVEQVQSIIDLIDWPCDLRTRFLSNNLGCGKAPSSAISWAFETTDRLIVLEDDCVPSLSFFAFCDEMLEKYKDDTRIGIVSGRSMQENCKYFGHYDYIFSYAAHTWGWATWKRCWSQYDLYMKDFPKFIEQGGCSSLYTSRCKAFYANRKLHKAFCNIDNEVMHSWDLQWAYTRIKNGYLGIVPRINLIENVGGGNGTHIDKEEPSLMIKAGEISFPLAHPILVIPNYKYEFLDFILSIKRKMTFNKIISFFKRKIM